MSTYLLIFAVIYVIICMCSKKSGKNRSVIWSLVWLVLMFINFANAQKLNEEMDFYREYYNNAEAVFDGIREISDNLEQTGSIFGGSESVESQKTSQESSGVPLGMQNALKKAKSYLDYSSFSYEGLIGQLEYEGYTHEQAVYGADNCGADWNEQAAKKAKSYLDYSAFSYEGLIKQLEYEKFTHEQAVYGVNNCGANW